MSCPPGIVYPSEKYGFKNKYKLDISTKKPEICATSIGSLKEIPKRISSGEDR